MIDPREVVSNFIFFDMSNLPGTDPMEALQEAAKGTVQVMPETHHYADAGPVQKKPAPLQLRPDYSGNFLKQLEKVKEKNASYVRRMMRKAEASPDNIKDFTMPSEWLKNVGPMPTFNTDPFIEFDTPENMIDDNFGGIGGIYYHENAIPEMTLDKGIRDREPNGPYRNPVLVKSVVASYLMDVLPLDLSMDVPAQVRVSKLLTELERSQKWSEKEHGYKPITPGGVTAVLAKNEGNDGRYTFTTTSGKGHSYRTVFQFITKGPTRDTGKLHVRVSCTCPSFLFWGAQFNAIVGNYLYGKIRPKYSMPRTRDPGHRFLVCKHILACIPKIPPRVGPGAVEKPYKFKYVVEVGRPEAVKIPREYRRYDSNKELQDTLEGWDDWSPVKRRQYIFRSTDPRLIAYLAHKFPDTATAYVAEKLNEMIQEGAGESARRDAQKALDAVNKMNDDLNKPVEIPEKYKKFDELDDIKQHIKEWRRLPDEEKTKRIDGFESPETLEYIVFKFPLDAHTGETARLRLERIRKTNPDPKVKEEARKALSEIRKMTEETRKKVLVETPGQQGYVDRWKNWGTDSKKKFLNGLSEDDSELMGYLWHKFPMDGVGKGLIIERLKELAGETPHGKALEMLNGLV